MKPIVLISRMAFGPSDDYFYLYLSYDLPQIANGHWRMRIVG
jgi:hypothetical protein